MAAPGLLKELEEKKREVEKELRTMEDHIYELETSYLTNSQNFGNIIKGYDQLLTQKSGQNLLLPTGRKTPGQKSFKDSERVFTLSSATNRQQIRVEEEEETRNTLVMSFGGSKRKAKLSKGEPKTKKRHKTKKSEDDTDFSEGTRN